VTLELNSGWLHCEVRDDGRGIDPRLTSSALSQGHHSLQLARKRLELAGGALTLAKTPDGGTSFAFDLPVTLRARQLEATA